MPVRRILLLVALLVALPAGAVTIPWVTVGDPGNAQDDPANNCMDSCGAVAYAYRIAKYEVTNAQYVAFLDAVAKSDPNGLYNPSMAITRSGSPGSYDYASQSGRANQPVVFVSWYDALRFANWLHNGGPTGDQGPATTEDGAYTFSDPNTVGARNPGAIIFLPTEAEWYKAAFYSAVSSSYFDYPTRSDEVPTSEAPPGGANSANYRDPITGATRGPTNVGAYTGSPSPYGTYDQAGNVQEWNESSRDPYGAGVRGGDWISSAATLDASSEAASDNLRTEESGIVGFRVAHVIPEPGTGALVLAGLLGLATRRRRRA
jgi:formylglycine-generating enzyme required for sulfatase activity